MQAHPTPRQHGPLASAEGAGGGFLTALGSLWFGAVLLLLAMFAMGAATVLEVSAGTETALRDIYGAWWFAALLGVLGVNLLAGMIARRPWTRRKAGFLMTHASLCVILLGAWITARWSINGQIDLLEGQSRDAIWVDGDQIIVEASGAADSVWIDLPRGFKRGGRSLPAVSVPGAAGVQVEMVDYAIHSEERLRVTDDNPQRHVAVEVELVSGGQKQTRWLSPEDAGTGSQIVVADVPDESALAGWREPPAADRPWEALLTILVGPGDQLHARLKSETGAPLVVPIVLGEPIPLGLTDADLKVTQRYTHARMSQQVEPAEPGPGNRQPAVRVRLREGGNEHHFWLTKQTSRSLRFGQDLLTLTYRDRALPMGFGVKLDDFRVRHYPGTQRPRSFESTVTFTDSAGRSEQRVISMNHPTGFGPYHFFQSSYSTDERTGRERSVLSVAWDPGQSVTFAGYGLLMLGMVWVLFSRMKESRGPSQLNADSREQGAER